MKFKCCKDKIIVYDDSFSSSSGVKWKMIYHCVNCGNFFEVFLTRAFHLEDNYEDIEEKIEKRGIYIRHG